MITNRPGRGSQPARRPGNDTIAVVHMLTLVMLLGTTTVVPLTEPQRRPLAAARDGSALLDEQAFYALLENAVSWQGTAADEAGAMIPDYAALHAAPGAHRGRLCLIEGKLRRSAEPGRFSRAGPWESTWRQWIVQWGPGQSDVAVIYLVDPPTVRIGAPVRLPARFYKIWRDTDQQGAASDYLVFVAKHAVVSSVRGTWTQTTVMTAALVVLALAYFLLRRWVAATRRRSSARTIAALRPN